MVNLFLSFDFLSASRQKFKSQFYDPRSNEPDTYISSKDFLNAIEARAIDFGMSIGVQYAEGFTANKNLGVKNLFDLI